MSLSRKEQNIASLNAAKAVGGTITSTGATPNAPTSIGGAVTASGQQLNPSGVPVGNAKKTDVIVPVVDTTSPSVITSNAATKDLDNITAEHAKIVEDIKNQTTTLANNKALADAQASLQAEKDAQAKIVADKAKTDKIAVETKAAAVKAASQPEGTTTPVEANPVVKETPYTGNADWYTVKRQDGTSQIVSKGLDGSYVPVSNAEIKMQDAQNQLDTQNAEIQSQGKAVLQTIEDIKNGTVPLNAGEIAQVQGLQQSFKQMVDQQNLINKGATGTAQIRGYQKGAAEYDPMFQINTIGTIVTAGANKVADLNIKMASAVAELTTSFQNNKITQIKSSWDMYQSLAKERASSLKNTIDTAQASIKAVQDAQAKIDAAKLKVDSQIIGSAESGYISVTTDSTGKIISSTRITEGVGKVEEPLNILDVQRYTEIYPEVGIVAGDTQSIANQKIFLSNSPENLIKRSKANGVTFDTVITEINKDDTIENKDEVIAIAKKVYNVGDTSIVPSTKKNVRSPLTAGYKPPVPVNEPLKGLDVNNINLSPENVKTTQSFINSIEGFLFKK